MKIKCFFFIALIVLPFLKMAGQVPLSIHFQAIARDGGGNLIIDQNIQIRLSVIDSITKKIVYQEIQAPILTDSFGYFDIKLNDSTNPDWVSSLKYGKFKDIEWVTGRKWLLIEYQAPATFKYTTIGEIELVTHPYALVAQTAIDVQGFNLANAKNGDILKYDGATKTWRPAHGLYNAGDGINISNDTVINTSPNIPVTLTGSGKTTVSGKYPDFNLSSPVYKAGKGINISNDSIINTLPNTQVSISGAGGSGVTGTYPNFTVNSAVYKAGKNISLTNNTFSFANDTATSYTSSSAPYAVYGTSNNSGKPFSDTPEVYAKAPSDGLYLITGRCTFYNYDYYYKQSYPFHVYLYNSTTSTWLVDEMVGVVGFDDYEGEQTGNPRIIKYLHKGDKVELLLSVGYCNSFYYSYPDDNVSLIKLK